MVHFVSFQTKQGFYIGVGPVSFNLTSLKKDHLLFELVSDRYHFSIRYGSKSTSELGLIRKTKNKTKIRLMLTINCLTKAN